MRSAKHRSSPGFAERVGRPVDANGQALLVADDDGLRCLLEDRTGEALRSGELLVAPLLRQAREHEEEDHRCCLTVERRARGPQASRRNLPGDAVVERNHAVGHVLLELVAGQAGLARLGSDDGGDVLILQPAKRAAQLGA